MDTRTITTTVSPVPISIHSKHTKNNTIINTTILVKLPAYNFYLLLAGDRFLLPIFFLYKIIITTTSKVILPISITNSMTPTDIPATTAGETPKKKNRAKKKKVIHFYKNIVIFLGPGLSISTPLNKSFNSELNTSPPSSSLSSLSVFNNGEGLAV